MEIQFNQLKIKDQKHTITIIKKLKLQLSLLYENPFHSLINYYLRLNTQRALLINSLIEKNNREQKEKTCSKTEFDSNDKLTEAELKLSSNIHFHKKFG